MTEKNRQIYTRIIAIFLLLVIVVPIVIQPGHYFLIEHHYNQHSYKNTVSETEQHFKCEIDDFQLAKVTLHSFIITSHIVCLNIALKFPHKQINTKSELLIPFSLRAPPIS